MDDFWVPLFSETSEYKHSLREETAKSRLCSLDLPFSAASLLQLALLSGGSTHGGRGAVQKISSFKSPG